MKYGCLRKKSGHPVDIENIPLFQLGFMHLGWFSGCLPSTVATPGFQSPDVAVDLKPHSLWPSCTFPANPTQIQHNTTRIHSNQYNHTNTTTPTQPYHPNPTQHNINTTSTPEPSIQAPGTSTTPVRRDLGPHQIIGIRIPPSLSWSSSWCHLILILIEDIGWIYPPTQDESHHQDYDIFGSESLWKLHSGWGLDARYKSESSWIHLNHQILICISSSFMFIPVSCFNLTIFVML